MSQNSDRPFVLLTVHNPVRELDAKILFAGELLKSGFNVVLGGMRKLREAAEVLPVGTFIDTRFVSTREEYYKNFNRLGSNVVTFDEEATAIRDWVRYKNYLVSTDSLRHCQAAFCWGDYHADAVREVLPEKLHGIVKTTGHPRFDLLRPRCREFYAEQVKELHRTYGRFILVNSNSGGRGVEGNIEERWANTVKSGFYADTPENYEKFVATCEHRIRRHKELASLIATLARTFPQHNVVVRPHFTENEKSWRPWLPDDLENIHIVHEGSVAPWLIASSVAIHSGCTTGIEAFLAGTPVICYLQDYLPGLDSELPNELSIKAGSEDEVVAIVGEAIEGRLKEPKAELERKHAIADKNVAARSGDLASERVTNFLKEIAVSGAENGAVVQKILENSEQSGVVENVPESEDPDAPGRYGRTKGGKKRPLFVYQGLEHRLQDLLRVMPDLPPLSLTSVSPKIYMVTPAEATDMRPSKTRRSPLRAVQDWIHS